MPPASIALVPPPDYAALATPARVLERLAAVVPEIQARAARLDQDGAFPAQDLALLRDLGALEVFGGQSATALELAQALRLVGRANLSLGRLFEGHVNGARLVAWCGDASQRRRLTQDLAHGRLFGVWNTEPAPGVRIRNSAAGLVLQGVKSFASGAGHIHRAVVTARTPAGERRMVLADGADPARADPSGWRVRGMKATASGLYDLTDLPANRETLLGKAGDYEREPRFSAGAWRFAAVQVGGVERILTLVRDHLAAFPDRGNMVHRARFGAAVIAARSAWMWVREGAQRAEDPVAGPDEIALVLMARRAVESAGLEVMETAARLVGTRAFFTDDPIDLACRDLGLYLRQPAPDEALDRAAEAFIARDGWRDDPLW